MDWLTRNELFTTASLEADEGRPVEVVACDGDACQEGYRLAAVRASL
jgi:hypothetical protein